MSVVPSAATSTPALPVTIWTLWHGTEVSGAGSLELRTDDVRIEVAATGAELVIPFPGLDGAHTASGHLTLYATTGDIVELDGSSELEEYGRRLRAGVCTLPELTLALRGLGSARAQPGRDHDRFFGPLLAARRAAQRAGDAAGRLAAIRAPALAAEIERVCHEFAVERFPERLPERRALEAELEDMAAPLRASLRRIADLAGAAASAGDDIAFVSWRVWAAECRALFVSADRCWLAAVPLLARTPVAKVRRWRWPWERAKPPRASDRDLRGAVPGRT